MPKKSSTESFKDWRPDPGLFGLPQHLSHLSGSHLVFPRLYTCVAYMVSILVYLPLLFSLLSFSSFIKNPFSHKPHELKNRQYTVEECVRNYKNVLYVCMYGILAKILLSTYADHNSRYTRPCLHQSRPWSFE